MQNYTLSGLVSAVKAKLRDADYSDEDIKSFLNMAQYEVLGADKYKFLERKYTFQAVEGGEIDTPKNLQTIIRVVADTPHGRTLINYLSPAEFQELPAGATEATWTEYGKHLMYHLSPLERTEEAEAQKFYNIHVYYLAKPTEMVENTDVPTIPQEFQEILILGAMARAEQARDNFDFAQIYENKYYELLTNMTLRYGLRNQGMGNVSRVPVRIIGRS